MYRKTKNTEIGIRNLKNTCYFNAVMQCLLGCSSLREQLISPPHAQNKHSCFNRKMQLLFTELTKPDTQQPCNPELIFNEICTLIKCDKFKGNSQEDAGEFLCHLIDKIIDENKAAGKLFTADQQNITKCKGCGMESGVEETFTMLTLDLNKSLTDGECIPSNMMHRPNSLQRLLHNYSNWVDLSKGNEYYCTQCGKHQPAKRKTEVLYGPTILAMQLKRFKVTNVKNSRIISKLNTKVTFDENLTLPCTLSSLGMTSQYQLKGVIEHRGESGNNGHYVAYVRDGNQWTELDDDTVIPTTWKAVSQLEAYILIWESIQNESAPNTQITDVKLLENSQSSIGQGNSTQEQQIDNSRLCYKHKHTTITTPTVTRTANFKLKSSTNHNAMMNQCYMDNEAFLSRYNYGGGKKRCNNSDDDYDPEHAKKRSQKRKNRKKNIKRKRGHERKQERIAAVKIANSKTNPKNNPKNNPKRRKGKDRTLQRIHQVQVANSKTNPKNNPKRRKGD